MRLESSFLPADRQRSPASDAVLRKRAGLHGDDRGVKAPNFLYMVGGKTAVAITRSSEPNRQFGFDQRRIGLHHVCFRARSREDIDELHRFLLAREVKIVHQPEDGSFAPGYYSVLFEDPEGIRLEVNFVPSKGVFERPDELPMKSMPGFERYPE